MDFNTSIRCHDLITENLVSPLLSHIQYLDDIKLLRLSCGNTLCQTWAQIWHEHRNIPDLSEPQTWHECFLCMQDEKEESERGSESEWETAVWCGFGQTVLRSVLGARQVAMRWNANKLPGSRCRSASLCRLVLTLHTHAVFHPF